MEAFLRERGYNYLWHVLPIKNLDSILHTKMLYTEYDRHKNRIQAGGAYSISVLDFDKPWRVGPGQYPGIYLSLTADKPELSSGEIALFFSLELLSQRNWHFNLYDRNGTFGYDTYTLENIDRLPNFKEVSRFYNETVGIKYHNEVVFHDSIPMSNCSAVYDGVRVVPIEEYGIQHKLSLVNSPGAFLYYSDIYYTGAEIPYLFSEKCQTSDDFYKKYCAKYLGLYAKIVEPWNTKTRIEDAISYQIVFGMDLFTYLFLNRF